jgi:hypothetical protein
MHGGSTYINNKYMPTAAEIKSFINDALADNTTRAITEQVMRDTLTELVDWTTEYNPTWVNRGTWSSATAYVLNDYVQLNGSTYRCILAHTNQTPPNATYWILIAAKGDAGANGNGLVNMGQSIFLNSSLENNTADNWTLGAAGSLETTDILNGLASLKLVAGASAVSANSIARCFIDKTKVYKITCWAKASSGTPIISLRLKCYNRSGVLINYVRGDVNSVYSNLNITTSWVKYEFFYLGIFVPGSGTTIDFHADTVSAQLVVWNNTASSTVLFSNIIVEELNSDNFIPSNLSQIPVGQNIFDPTNRARMGERLSDGNNAWFTGKELALYPNGTSISMVVQRPYKWTWALLYNDGVTTVTLPSATINANAAATFVLTGTAGKSYTILIYQTV